MSDANMTTPGALTPRHQLANLFEALGDFPNISWAIKQGTREYPFGFSAELEFQSLTQHEHFLRNVESALASLYDITRDLETKGKALQTELKNDKPRTIYL